MIRNSKYESLKEFPPLLSSLSKGGVDSDQLFYKTFTKLVSNYISEIDSKINLISFELSRVVFILTIFDFKTFPVPSILELMVLLAILISQRIFL